MAVVGEVSSIQLPNGNEYKILDNDAALAKTPTDIPATEETFVYQRSSGDSCKYIKRIKGETIAWNQLQKASYSHLVVDNSQGEAAVSGNIGDPDVAAFDIVVGRKYYIRAFGAGLEMRLRNAEASFASNFQFPGFYNAPITTTNGRTYLQYRVAAGYRVDTYVAFIDLTLMFGAGNEPSTVAEFEALYHELDYPYNAGVLKSNDAAALLTDGRNQWDEETRNGYYNDNGEFVANAGWLCCKNPIPAFESTQYYVQSPVPCRVLAYDSGGNFISAIGYYAQSSFTTPAGTRFIKFHILNTYGTTYKNDICINLSDPSFNGTYEPYWQRVLALRLSELTGIPEGGAEADRVTMFPNGLGGAGSAFDSIFVENGVTKARKTMARVDMGDLSWTYYAESGHEMLRANIEDVKRPSSSLNVANIISPRFITDSYMNIYRHDTQSGAIGVRDDLSGIVVRDDAYTDADTFKAAMDGVYLEYELATPIVYTDLQYADGTPFTMPATILVDENGTEKVIYPESETPFAPFACDSFYATISAESIIDSLNLVKERMVFSPAESTDGHVVVFNGEYGKSVKDSGLTIATSVPSGAVFTDTHRPIKVNSTQLLGNNATPVNFTAAGSATVVGEGDTITIASPPNRVAASGGTDTSVVTTGEKYTWNNKGTYSKPSGGIPKTDLASAVQTSLGKADTALQSHKYRGIQVNGLVKLTDTDATYLEFKGGGLVDVTYDDADGLMITGPSKVTSVSSSSTDNQVPTAKCLYTLVGDIESLLAALR